LHFCSFCKPTYSGATREWDALYNYQILDIINRPFFYLKLNSTLQVFPYLTENALRLRYETTRLVSHWHVLTHDSCCAEGTAARREMAAYLHLILILRICCSVLLLSPTRLHRLVYHWHVQNVSFPPFYPSAYRPLWVVFKFFKNVFTGLSPHNAYSHAQPMTSFVDENERFGLAVGSLLTLVREVLGYNLSRYIRILSFHRFPQSIPVKIWGRTSIRPPHHSCIHVFDVMQPAYRNLLPITHK
jgi:hypothetical protein